MNKSQRERAAKYWLKKYGEPIDTDELKRVASPRHLSLNRLITRSHQSHGELADLLERQAEELREFFTKRFVRGTATTLADSMKEHNEQRGDEEAVRPFPFALVEQHLGFGLRLARSARTHAARFSSWEAPPSTRALDLELGFACHHVSEWIRKRHRERSGALDGKTSWPDVVKCLEWHRVPIGRLEAAGDLAGAARRRVDRLLQATSDREDLDTDV